MTDLTFTSCQSSGRLTGMRERTRKRGKQGEAAKVANRVLSFFEAAPFRATLPGAAVESGALRHYETLSSGANLPGSRAPPNLFAIVFPRVLD